MLREWVNHIMANNLQIKKAIIQESEEGEGRWTKTWRPHMAYAYMAICLFDFMVGPFLWSIFQIIGKGTVALQWVPLTLTGGGIFHVAMGAVLGIAAFTRGQEKVQQLKTLEELRRNDDSNITIDRSTS